ncbi:hypothetical protein BGW38_009247 [Lunasporangiospora selenospora]|uniref:Selenoprotein O n=1 Tax=Lunasporangiospora selenospora TaxID=979761 RepID=A0A9P6FY41_9FUNG|nr:hypothetical protein BGW38_009247 [Lunasporangiospora selenospora]
MSSCELPTSMSSASLSSRAALATPVPFPLPRPRFPAKLTSSLPCDELSAIDPEDGDEAIAVPDSILRSPRVVRNAVYSFVNPEDQSKDAFLLGWNKDMAQRIGVDPAKTESTSWTEEEREHLITFLTGGGRHLPRELQKGSIESDSTPRLAQPWAHCYAGHQFGYYAGQLGDGRAISLFETVDPITGEPWELQLKGAGKTPYSRFADGYAVLRSSIREYLCAEAVAALGVASSRSLAIISTGTTVIREDGGEPGSIVCRVAPTWIRFGSFEIFYYRKDMKNVRRLAEYVCDEIFHIERDDPAKMAEFEKEFRTLSTQEKAPPAESMSGAPSEAEKDTSTEDKGSNASTSAEDNTMKDEAPDAPKPMYLNRYAKMFAQVARRTALMVSGWQAIGFCHGVMNTDNMSILGLTIDYGPFAFLDKYDPAWVCNHSDAEGRYSFQQQPGICLWNLGRLAITLENLIGAQEKVDDLKWIQEQESDPEKAKGLKENATDIVVGILNENFRKVFLKDYRERMNAKMGLGGADLVQEDDLTKIVVPALAWMDDHEVDFHEFFRVLAEYKVGSTSTVEENAFQAENFIKRLVPSVVLQVRSETVFEDAKTWMGPYHQRLVEKDELRDDKTRQTGMNKTNPAFVLRNWVAQKVIERVTESVKKTRQDSDEEDPDKDLLDRVLWMCQNPFGDPDLSESLEVEGSSSQACQVRKNSSGLEAYGEFVGPVPEWGQGIQCSCSS